MIHNDITFTNTFLMGNVIKGTDDWRVIKKNKNIMKSISFLSPNTSSEEKKERENKCTSKSDRYIFIIVT